MEHVSGAVPWYRRDGIVAYVYGFRILLLLSRKQYTTAINSSYFTKSRTYFCSSNSTRVLLILKIGFGLIT